MPSYIVDRAQAKEAYLGGLATRAVAGVVTTTPTTSTSTTTVPQAVVPWVPPVDTSTTARPAVAEHPRQQDLAVGGKKFV